MRISVVGSYGYTGKLICEELNKTKSGGTPYGASHVESFNSSNELSRDEYEIAKKSGTRLAKLIHKINV